MKNTLPLILGAGFFESKKRFADRLVTLDRPVKCFEIELFAADGGCSVINGVRHPIRKGNLLIARPGDMRHSELHFSCRYIHAEIRDEMLQGLLKSIPSFLDFNCEGLSELFDEINSAMLSFDEYSIVLANAKLLLLFYKIKEISEMLGKNLLTDTLNTNFVSKAIEFMEDNYSSHLSVNDVALHCNLSVSYFHKIFTESTHLTPNAYLNNIRIAAAKKLLISSDDPIDIIAEKCGFSSQVYFTYCFKKSVAMPPGKYREHERYPL